MIDFLRLCVTFWKFIRSHAVTPHWLGNAKECIQSGWSKQRDCYSWQTNSQPRMLVASKAAVLKNYLAVSTWILNGSSIECHEKKDFKWVFDWMPREEASTFQPFQFILCSIWKPGDSNFWVKICLELEEFIFQVEWLIATLIYLACENSRPSSLPARVAFRVKDVCDSPPKIPYWWRKSVPNLVRSADWFDR